MMNAKLGVAGLAAVVALAGCAGSGRGGEGGCEHCVAWQERQSPYIKELAAQEKVLKGLSEEIRDQKKVVAAAPQDTLAQRKLSDLQARYEREEAIRMDMKTSADRRTDHFRADQSTGANTKMDGRDHH